MRIRFFLRIVNKQKEYYPTKVRSVYVASHSLSASNKHYRSCCNVDGLLLKKLIVKNKHA